MKKYFTTSVGVLRLIAFLEGSSLLLLVLIAVPAKYFYGNPALVKSIGPVHGVLFLLFVYAVFRLAAEREWKFADITWKVLLASVVPFGTFYIDSKILRHLQAKSEKVGQ